MKVYVEFDLDVEGDEDQLRSELNKLSLKIESLKADNYIGFHFWSRSEFSFGAELSGESAPGFITPVDSEDWSFVTKTLRIRREW